MKNGFGLGTNRELPFFPRYTMVGSVSNGEYNLKVRQLLVLWRTEIFFNPTYFPHLFFLVCSRQDKRPNVELKIEERENTRLLAFVFRNFFITD